MPNYSYSSGDARGHILENRYAFWGLRQFIGDTVYVPASERLQQEVFIPHLTPKFQIRREDRVFAIGSCFARALEESLRPLGFDVESYHDDDLREFADERKTDYRHTPDGPVVDIAWREITNKYNTFSMLQQLEWVFDHEVPPETTFLDAGDGLVQDPHVCPIHKLADVPTTLRRRRAMHPIFARLPQCQLLVITLGLTEVWRDQQTGLYLNMSPDRAAIRANPGRFQCLATGFQDNLDALNKLYALVRRVAPAIKLLVTVSPVALAATFRPIDVVTANMASKCTLRTVAEEWVAAHPDIDYFPSFELVLHSRQDVVRKDDYSHVKMNTARTIMDLFVTHYVA
jgi:hypothetical protein